MAGRVKGRVGANSLSPSEMALPLASPLYGVTGGHSHVVLLGPALYFLMYYSPRWCGTLWKTGWALMASAPSLAHPSLDACCITGTAMARPRPSSSSPGGHLAGAAIGRSPHIRHAGPGCAPQTVTKHTYTHCTGERERSFLSATKHCTAAAGFVLLDFPGAEVPADVVAAGERGGSLAGRRERSDSRDASRATDRVSGAERGAERQPTSGEPRHRRASLPTLDSHGGHGGRGAASKGTLALRAGPGGAVARQGWLPGTVTHSNGRVVPRRR